MVCVCCNAPAKKKYCSLKCQGKATYEKSVQAWKARQIIGWTGITKKIKPFVRKYLFQKYDSKCCKCGWSAKHPVTQLVPLEVNHIDGDAENSWEENLELLCPNCHSLTPNFRNLNSDSKRVR